MQMALKIVITVVLIIVVVFIYITFVGSTMGESSSFLESFWKGIESLFGFR